MKHTRKILVALLVLMSILMSLAVVAIPASAANISGGEKFYLIPNSDWKTDNARFAVYFFNDSTGKNAWVDMVDTDGDGIYEATSPSGTWEKLIFCRMNPSTTENNWDNKWNQTSNLTYTSYKCYAITGWDNSGKWISASASGTYYVAGTLGGGSWTVNDSNHIMTANSTTKTFSKTYYNVAKGTYEFKVTDGSWSNAYPSSNYVLTLSKDACRVTILFDLTQKSPMATVTTDHIDANKDHDCDHGCGKVIGTCADSATDEDHICDYGCEKVLEDCFGGTATCTAKAECSVCGESYGDLAAHTEVVDAAVAATCTATGLTEGKHCSVCNTVITAQETVSMIAHSFIDASCTACGAKQLTSEITYTEALDIFASKGSLSDDFLSISWGSDNLKVVNQKNTSTTAIRTSDTNHFRVYKGNTTTISASKITKVVITCTGAEYATVCANSLVTSGVTASVSDSIVTLTVDSGSIDIIKLEATAQWRLSKVEVTCTVSSECVHTNTTTTVVGATCDESGKIVITCDDCGESTSANNASAPALGHSYNANHVCEVCGKDDPSYYFEMTIADALAAADGKQVQITGTIVKIHYAYSSSNNCISVYVADANGNEIYLYKLSGGAELAVHDTIIIKGAMATYNGNRQIAEGATYEFISSGECTEFTDATCTAAPKCVLCGTENGEALGHNYVDGSCSRCGAEKPVAAGSATITFDADKTQRTEYSTEVQRWENQGLIFINNKSGSTSNVGDYSNPGRFYKGSEIIISFTGMTSLVIDAATVGGEKYSTPWGDTLTAAGLTYTNEGEVYTITFTTPVDSITLTTTAQVRASSITATAGNSHVHSWSDATCTDPAKCECGETNGEALGHTEVVDAAVAPTCTETGLTEGKKCSVCNEVLVAQDVVDALGHDYVKGVCSVCGDKQKFVDVPNEIPGVDDEIIEEIQTSGALVEFAPTNVPSEAKLVIELVGISFVDNDLSSIVYEVAPMKDGEKVAPIDAITFRLPVPASATKDYARVYHEDQLMGIYAVKSVDGAKYVELSSKDFSEYSLELVDAVATIGDVKYESLADAITAAQAGDTVVLLANVDSMPAINKAITLKGVNNTINVNCAIAENFANINGTVTFENLIFNDRISTENASNDQSKMTLKFVGCTFNIPAGNTYAIQGGASWNNDVLGALVVENCVFNTAATSFVKGYMVYAQCVKSVSVTGSTFDGGNVFRGAMHLGDSTQYATVATISGNTIKNIARGVQVGNRVEGSTITIDGNTFENVGVITGETESATVYIHEVANVAATEIVYTNNEVGDSLVVFSENATGAVPDFVTSFTDNTANGVAIELEGNYKDTVYVAPSYAAQIGDVKYESLADALAAAKTMSGDVVVEILDKVTLNENLSGNFDSITFVGKDTDAEIYLDVQGYITASGKTVSFEDLILSKSTGGFITNAGFMNVAFGVYDVTEVTYTNCTFANGAYASSGDVTYTDCTFYRSHDKYGLWAYGNANIVVDGCIFDDYRGIKMYAEGAAKVTDLTVKNTDFSALDSKPAIVLTYGESVTLEGNTYSSTGVFELDLDGAPNGTVVDAPADITCKNDNGACGVLVDGKIYTTVAQAAEVATEGDTVTLLHDSTEIVELAEGVILDKNGYTADGVTVKVFKPAGNIQVGYITTNYNNSGRHGLFGEAVGVTAKESFVVMIYSGDTLVGTAALVDTDKVLLDGQSRTISWHILVGEDNDSWWNTEWVDGALNVNAIPDKVELYVDGVKVSEGAVKLNSSDDSNPIIAAVTDANGNVQSFVAADGYLNNLKNVAANMNAAIENANDGSTVVLLRDIAIDATVKVTADAAITLDLNGKTMDGTGNVNIAVMSYGDLTVKDSSVEQSGVIKAGIGAAGNAVNICGGTFTLESGSIYSLNNAILIDEQAATVNINGGKITAEPTTRNSAAFYISSTSDTVVNINDGTIVGYNGILLWDNTTLNISGGSIDAEGSVAIQGNGSKDNTEINISGDASISGYYAAIYHPQGGDLNISGGTLSGWTGIVVKGGNVNISGGTISGTGAANAYKPVSSGFQDTGDALYVEHYDNSTSSENYGTPVVTITGGTFNSANANAVGSYANSNNSVEALTGFISGGTFNTDVSAYLADGYSLTDNGDGTYGVALAPVAKIGDVLYYSFEDAVAAAQIGDEIILLADVTLSDDVTLPDGIILNGNGFAIDGSVIAGESLTIAGHTRITSFSAGFYNHVINIGAGACLEITGTDRVTLGWGSIFNITGTITDAKSTDKSTVQPSLIIPGGVSITGSGATLNVTNAYIQLGLSSSKNSVATDNFDINFTNSIVDFTNNFSFATSTSGKTPVFDIDIVNSVVNCAKNLDFSNAACDILIDNSIVTVGSSMRNDGTLKLVNGSELTVLAQIQSGEHGGNNGTITVDNSKLTIECSSTGHAMDGNNVGKLEIINSGEADIDYIIETEIYLSVDSNLVSKSTDLVINTAEGYVVINNDGSYSAIKVAAKIGDVYYETFADAYAAAQAGETIVLLEDVLLTGKFVIAKAITIDGKGLYGFKADETAVWYTVSGKLNIKNYNVHLIGVNSDNVTLKNITLDCNNNAAGINIYCAQNVVFEDVSVINATKGFAGITVNGSTLTAKGSLTVLGNAIALDISNGSGVTSPLGFAVEDGCVLDLGDKTVKFASAATIDAAGAVNAEGKPYFVATDNAYLYTEAQMNGRTTAYSNPLTLLADVELSADLKLKATLDLNGHTITFAEGKGFVCDKAGYMLAKEDDKYILIQIVAKIGDTNFASLADAIAAAADGEEIEIIVAGTYKLVVSGRNVTVTGAVDGVVFEGMGAYNMNGASVIFNNVTFNWTNDNYKGLQHAGDLVYNNCIINGQVSLYGNSEIFNECTFNQTSKDAYNVWTYGAKSVEFNKCVFNSAGKSVLVYTEDKAHFIDLVITETEFIASAAVDGKAAIEIDTSLTAGANIEIDGATTAVGFANGSVSGSTLYNNKKGREGANNDVTLTINGETVLEVIKTAELNGLYYTTIDAALAAAKDGDTVTLVNNVTLDSALVIDKAITLDGAGYTLTSSADRAINVNCNGAVGIKNLTIVNGADVERAINVIQKAAALTIDNVVAEDFTYTINVAASSVGSSITINGGKFSGYAAINLTGSNTTVVVNDAELIGINDAPLHQSNNFGVIAIGSGTACSNLSVTVNGGKITATSANGNKQYIVTCHGATSSYAYIDAELVLADGEVLYGESDDIDAYFRADYADELAARGYVTNAADNGMIVVAKKLPYYIGADGYWYFNGEKTEHKAVGTDGNNFTIGADGYWYLNGEKTEYKAVATDADQYTIGEDGYWYLNGNKTEYKALGTDGKNYTIGEDGYWYLNGEKTEHKAIGTDGTKVEIGDDGYWYINDVKTEYKAVGEDGKTPTFKVEGGHLWATFDNESWTDLGQVVGNDGAPGTDGKTPTLKVEDGHLWVSYDDGATWEDLGNVTGADGNDGSNGINGKTPIFQIVEGVLQVSYDNGTTWADVGNVAGANGTAGVDGKTPTFQIVEGVLQVSYDNGTTWANVGTVAGENGSAGVDGKTPTFQIVEGVLQVSYDNGATWKDIAKVSGENGAAGIDGKTPTFQIVEGVLQVSYDNGTTWANVGNVAGSAGLNGKTPTFKIEDGELKVSYDDGASWTGLGQVVGANGMTPSISENGNWIIGGVETDYPAIGKDGDKYTIGEDGYWYLNGEKTEYRAIGVDGKTPTFKIEDGNLFVSYDDGASWTDLGRVVGKDGITPHIGENGNWWIGDKDTGVPAKGQDGKAPFIGENGNWWIGDTDTGITAIGKDGNDNNEIILLCIGMATLCLITTIVALVTRKSRYRWWILT